jgi:hypothetical protein
MMKNSKKRKKIKYSEWYPIGILYRLCKTGCNDYYSDSHTPVCPAFVRGGECLIGIYQALLNKEKRGNKNEMDSRCIKAFKVDDISS